MDKLKMQTVNIVDENIAFLAQKFPNCIVESKNEEGETVKSVDFEMLKQELSKVIVDGDKERYVMTWPDKKQSILTANAPISKTLRPYKDESVNFDTTENLYIEGDNLDALKLLRETYLNKVKMIYIDPPYNTGNDFVYNDDFAVDTEEYLERSNQKDEQGNRMVVNNDSNGRFHTDWLNMIYPRLKLAKDLLSDDGVIFISIDDHEQANLRKICDEIFGVQNFVAQIANISNPKGRSDDKFVATAHEYVFIYSKKKDDLRWFGFEPSEEIIKRYNKIDESGKKYREIDLRKTGDSDLREDRPNLFYYFYYNEKTGDFYPSRDEVIPAGYMQIKPLREDGKDGRWRVGMDTAIQNKKDIIVKWMPARKIWGIMEKNFLEGRSFVKPTSSWTYKDVNSERGSEEFIGLGFDKRIFTNPKPIGTIKRCMQLLIEKDDIVLDFFSGSATTAHAVMQLNAEDGGNRKFIMVQLPEITDEKSEAYKAGYKNICEIGKERIRRAGKKIQEANRLTAPNLDVGFRVLKLDESNMKEVYYNPELYNQNLLTQLEENIKEDRDDEDLLFQVMLEMGVLLSSKVEELTIENKKIFNVNDGNLICCFEKNISENVVTEIAKMKPLYAIFRNESMAKDSVATNFDQIFETFSSSTERKVL